MTAVDNARARGIVVVGAGQAGGRVVEALRADGFAGPLTLVGDEHHPPYERPSLSKEMLLDGVPEDVTWVHTPEFFAANAVAFRPGAKAMRIDRAQRRVDLSDGGSVDYGALVLAMGARPRRLDVPGAAEAGIHYLRSLNDSRTLRGRLAAGQRVLVIGAGFIGLEVAAAAIKRGCVVTIVEAASLPLGRVAPAEIGHFFRDLHVRQGVSFRFDTVAVEIRRQGAATIVVTESGEELTADIIVAGIGVVPNSEIGAEAGLMIDRGLITDAFGASSDPDIFAIGDVARHYNPWAGRHILLESWQNAQNQAIAVARNLAGSQPPRPYREVPWFWSTQYEAMLQIYGLAQPNAKTVMRGRPDRPFLLFQLQDDRIIYAAGINAARELRALRELMDAGTPVSAGALADPAIGLVQLARSLKQPILHQKNDAMKITGVEHVDG